MDDRDSNDGDSHKRYYVDESQDNPKKRINRGPIIHLKILIHTNLAGIVIGKGGETIGSIQKDTSAKIKLSKSKEYFPGTQERVCLISGSKDSIIAAFCIIHNKIAEEKRSTEGSLRLLIPNTLAGMIIGKNGSYITHIKQQCRVRIELSTRLNPSALNHNTPYINERILTMNGREEFIEQALAMILDKMVQSINNYTPVLNLCYHTGSGSSLDPHYGPAAEPKNDSFDPMSLNCANTGGFDKNALKEISLALATLAKYGILDLLTAASPTLNMLMTAGANSVINCQEGVNSPRNGRPHMSSPSSSYRQEPSTTHRHSLLGSPINDHQIKHAQSLLGSCPESCANQPLFPPLKKLLTSDKRDSHPNNGYGLPTSGGYEQRRMEKVMASILGEPKPTPVPQPHLPNDHWDDPITTSILGEAPLQ